MKSRKSNSGNDNSGKEVLSSLPSNTDSPSIVRKLRSRVITSDTEEDCHVRTRTPKSNRKATRETPKCQQDDGEVSEASLQVEGGACMKTPKRCKRLSAVNLFQIVEDKEEDYAEESDDKVKEEGTENACSESTFSGNVGTGSPAEDNVPSEDNAMPSRGVMKTKVSLPEESEKDTTDAESLNSAQNEETAEGENGEEEETIQNSLMDEEPVDRQLARESGSDDDAPETVSFSSSKNTINSELTLIAEAIKKGKARKKDRIRKKIEMIRTQKAEKEERRKQKMKFLEVNVPERLAEDVASSLPDKPIIPTVKKSTSINKKRKNEEKVSVHRIEKKKNKILKFDDYIPITNVDGSTQFGVVPLEVTARLPKPSSQSAAEFKQKALFGSRIRREPSKNLLIYRQKLNAAGRLQKSFTSSSMLKI